MKRIDIQSPCSENWEKMLPTENGKFCQACAKNVIDFTGMTTEQITLILDQNQQASLCMRIKSSQLDRINQEYAAWQQTQRQYPQALFVSALLLIFGLGLFSCSEEKDQQHIRKIQETAQQILQENTVEKDIPAKPDSTPANAIIPKRHHSYPKAPEVTAPEVVPDEITVSENRSKDTVYPFPQQETERNIYIMGTSLQILKVDRQPEISEPLIEYDENGVPLPTEFEGIAYPNPTHGNATVALKIPEEKRYELRVFDMEGRFLSPLYEGTLRRGTHTFQLDLLAYPPGMYLVQVISGSDPHIIRVVKQ